MIVHDSILSQNITLVNLYASNLDDPQFFHDLFFNLPNPSVDTYIGGDFNLALDPTLDRSSTKQTTLTRAAKALKAELKSSGLCDIWRMQDKLTREYSFYSPTHNSFSRIDMFLIPLAKAHTIPSCEYLARTISDHSGLLITIPATDTSCHGKRWRFNSYLLNDPEFLDFINTYLDVFFETNQNSTSPDFIWESMKAYIRGQIISSTSSRRKKYNLKVESLEKEIKQLEQRLLTTQNTEIEQKLRSKQLEYNTTTTHKIENAMRRTRQKFYEQGDKTGKLLAWQIRREEAQREIHILKSGPNNITDPKEIMHLRNFMKPSTPLKVTLLKKLEVF